MPLLGSRHPGSKHIRSQTPRSKPSISALEVLEQ
jgi:hypothetical protein